MRSTVAYWMSAGDHFVCGASLLAARVHLEAGLSKHAPQTAQTGLCTCYQDECERADTAARDRASQSRQGTPHAQPHPQLIPHVEVHPTPGGHMHGVPRPARHPKGATVTTCGSHSTRARSGVHVRLHTRATVLAPFRILQNSAAAGVHDHVRELPPIHCGNEIVHPVRPLAGCPGFARRGSAAGATSAVTHTCWTPGTSTAQRPVRTHVDWRDA